MSRTAEPADFEDICSQNFIPGKYVNSQTGRLDPHPGMSVIFEPVRVKKGAVVSSPQGTGFQIHYYSLRIRDELIHTYTYDEECIYTYYIAGEYPETFSAEPAVIREDGFIRIVLDGCTDAEFSKIIRISNNEPVPYALTEEQSEMCRRILDSAEKLREDTDALFLMLTDTHYGCGSNFEETAFLLKELASKLKPDGLIHLGDLTDGSLPAEWTKKYALRVIRALKKTGVPCHFLVGNHDFNYFKGNPGRFTQKEREDLYLDGREENRITDLREKQLRLIFLNSFDPAEKHRYGFSIRTVWFLIKALISAPKGFRIIVLSHVPPLGEIHYWDRNVRHSGLMTGILDLFQRFSGNTPVYIHGHNHCDQIYLKKGFPIAGIGPSKLEDFEDKKPAGSFTPRRNQYDGTSALFDILIVKEKKLLFLRYGAGNNRTIDLDRTGHNTSIGESL